jgi:hypothetical protein
MSTRVNRQTVDLSAYPDLVVIYLGMRVNRLYGLRTLMGYGPRIGRSATERPDGLLAHETFLWSMFPMHGAVYDTSPSSRVRGIRSGAAGPRPDVRLGRSRGS